MRRSWVGLGVAVVIVGGAQACETYDSPPRPFIEGLTDGILTDPLAPLVIRFSEPIDPETLRLTVIRLETTEEGLLPDEDDDPLTNNTEYFAHDPVNANFTGGTGTLVDNDTAFVIQRDTPFPVGPSLAVVIEAGLADLEGRTQDQRLRLTLAYRPSCELKTPTSAFPSGTYFFLANVDEPIMTQVQLWARIQVDEATGDIVGQFTNADRNPDPNRCSPPCDASEACRTVPDGACVIPSQEAASLDEFSDWIPNTTPPTGYSFRVVGCVIDQGTSVTLVTEPTDVDIQSPPIRIEGIRLSSSFAEASGVTVGTGSVTSKEVYLLGSASGAAAGTVLARLVPEDQAPNGVPAP